MQHERLVVNANAHAIMGVMLYTGKGDLGETGMFGCDQRISKSSEIAEALGTLDEINSFLGFAKIHSRNEGVSIHENPFFEVLENVQQKLFIVQAQMAGAAQNIDDADVLEIEKTIADIEKELPEISTFFISGGCELSATLDYARTIARRAERRVVAVREEGKVAIPNETLKYMNRLSSLLYAMARYANVVLGIDEQAPTYE
jgi:cob(I)alamin adenosyltransferase